MQSASWLRETDGAEDARPWPSALPRATRRGGSSSEGLLVLAGRLDDGGDLAYTIRQNLNGLSRQPQGQRPPISTPSNLEQAAGVTLFLVVTACWMLGLVSAELDWIAYSDFFVVVATGLSIVSLVLTGYLGRLQHLLLLRWIPGAAMMAIGFAMTPDPGGDETGRADLHRCETGRVGRALLRRSPVSIYDGGASNARSRLRRIEALTSRNGASTLEIGWGSA